MSSEQKYNLSWQSYADHLRDMMHNMMISDPFTDVTLVTDDKKSVKAHRNILSACSPVFKYIFSMEADHNHPVVYLRGIKYSEVETILKLIYQGEATFYDDRMKELLEVAKDLEITRLSYHSSDSNLSHESKDNAASTEALQDINATKAIKKSCEYSNTKSTQKGEKDYVDCDFDSRSLKDEVDITINTSHHDLVNTEAAEEIHVQSKSVQSFSQVTSVGSKFQCNLCDKLFTYKNAANQHIRGVHKGVKYDCDYCGKRFSQSSSLNTHIQAVHNGVKYACKQCVYECKRVKNLRAHIEAKHDNVTHNCQQCEYKANSWRNLYEHRRLKHEGVKYARSPNIPAFVKVADLL